MNKLYFMLRFFFIAFTLHHSIAFPSTKPCLKQLQSLFAQDGVTSKASIFGHGENLNYLASHKNLISLEDKTDFKILSYNVLNLEMTQGKYIYNESDQFVRVKPPKLKRAHHRREQAKIIKQLDPDIALIIESEGHAPLARFNTTMLSDNYIPLMISGNDVRGIDTGILIKRNLKIKASIHSFKNYQMNYPNKINGTLFPRMKIFSRDFPLIELRRLTDNDDDAPFLVIGAVHLKSKRNRWNDFESNLLRQRQVEAMLEIQKLHQGRYSKRIPYIFAGDFNTDVTASELDALNNNNFSDVFDFFTASQLGECNCRTTHTFHPKNAETVYHQLDSIRVNQIIKENSFIQSAGIFRYRRGDGRETPLPRSFEQRQENPSDHFPVWISLDAKKLLE